MSLQDLINQVNSRTVSVAATTPAEVPTEPQELSKLPLFDASDATTTGLEELMEQSRLLVAWLEAHESQPGTNNTLDINGCPYNALEYEKRLLQYENIELEVEKRLNVGLDLEKT